MKYSRLEKLHIEKADNEDKWILSFCASHILGLAPVLLAFSNGLPFYIVYTILFMILWKRLILK